ncbi:MAG: acyltransferase, partial [Bacteroidales bacterium]|nr:acyltransferase [Bacteroidales bacterium]
HFEFTECINPEIERLAGLERHEQLLGVCEAIDRHIHANYHLYPCNYIAYDQRMGTDEMRSRYTDDDLRSFNEYLDGQLAKVQKEVDFTLADDDYKYMRDMMLVMYSNPVVNKRKLVEV